MRILILGNSPHFSHSLSFTLTLNPSTPSSSSIRLHSSLIEYELVLGTEEMDAGRRVWPLEVLQCDGVIYALVSENDQNWISKSSPSNFLSILQTVAPSFPPRLPSILVSPSLQQLSLTQLNQLNQNTNNIHLPNLKRSIEIDPFTGENCHLALLSLVHWVNKNIYI